MWRSNASPYNSTQHGLVGLTKSIALEGRAHDIAGSTLHPGNILTERHASSDSATDQEPMMPVDELAETTLVVVMPPLHVNKLENDCIAYDARIYWAGLILMGRMSYRARFPLIAGAFSQSRGGRSDMTF